MYCPECSAEYRQGFTRCSDCDVDLVWELPREPHDDVNLVKIFQTGNPALAPVVESLLEDAKIECAVRNRLAHHLAGGAATGLVEFWVRDDEAGQARALLADLVGYDGAAGHE